MLDFADFVAINKFDRKGAAGRAARRAQAGAAQPRGASASAPDEMPVFGTIAARFNDDGVTALYQALLPRLAELGLKLERRRAAAGRRRATARTRRRSCRRRARATSPRSPRPCAATSSARASRRGSRASASSCATPRACCASDKPDRRRPRDGARSTLVDAARGAARPAAQASCSTMWPRDAEGLRRRRVRGEDPRQGDPHRADPHVAVGHARSARSRCRSYEDHGEMLRWLLLENVPGSSRTPPACSRSSARTRTRRACSPAKATRSAPTGASTCSSKACRPSGCRPRSTR